MDRRPVEQIIAAQLMLIATRQFCAVPGGSEDALRWAVKDRWLEPYRWRGVYRLVGSSAIEQQPLMGACLAAGDDALACGLGAAWAYGVPEIAPALEIGVPGRVVRLKGVRSRVLDHDCAQLHDVRLGIPVVSSALCVVQVAQTHQALSQLVTNNLVARNMTDFAEVLQCLDLVAPHGRGARALRRFCLRELEVRGHDDSPAARKLGRALLRAGLAPFETQFVVDTGEGLALLDFA